MASAALESSLPSSPEPPSWLSPRISFSFDLPDEPSPSASLPPPATPDFEFPNLPLPLSPPDDLISAGKLLPPLLLPAPPPLPPPSPPPPSTPPSPDPSPKAPRCSARLRDIIRLRRDAVVRRLLPRRKPDDPATAPLLPPPQDAPRHSLDSAPRPRPTPPRPPARSASVDSPRLNPSGKVVFQGLERSSSSPGSFSGGPRAKPRSIERSFSANVRVSPVINVFGFAPVKSGRRKSSKAEPS